MWKMTKVMMVVVVDDEGCVFDVVAVVGARGNDEEYEDDACDDDPFK